MSGPASHHGQWVDPLAAVNAWRPAPSEPPEVAPGDGMDSAELVCRHGSGSGDLPDKGIARFARWEAEGGTPRGWWLRVPSRSAVQGPARGRRPGAWTFTCPTCRTPVTVQDVKVQAWLDAAHAHGVSVVDLWGLTH